MWLKKLPLAKFQQALAKESLDSANTRRWAILTGLWLLALIATPIGIWTLGMGVFPALASLGVLAQAAATTAALAVRKSSRQILLAFGIIALGTWAGEALGVATGFPFGHYHYTAALQPQAAGVPLLILLAWWMMIVPAWGAAEILLGHWRGTSRWFPLAFAALSALALTAWDLYLDPQMVAKGLWVWEQPGGYFGIPWVNFLGWMGLAFVLTLAARPASLPRLHLLVIYSLTWLFQAVGLGIFWGQPGPALVGFAGMGLFALAAWRVEVRSWN